MQHAHPSGIYTAACRACRLNYQRDRITHSPENDSLGAEAARRATHRQQVARELVGRHLWSSGQRRALRAAANLGVNLMDLSEWVEAAQAEVEGR